MIRLHTAAVQAAILTAALLAGACGDLKTVSYIAPPTTKLSNYSYVEVATFETEVEDVPQEALTLLPKAVAEEISEAALGFKKVVWGDEELPYEEGTFVIFGTIVDYQPGTELRAEGGSIKFGEAALTLRLSIVDKATGREITNGEINSSSSLGFLKRGFITAGVYDAIAKEVVRFIRDNS